MVTPTSRSRRIVPIPKSNRSALWAILIRTEQLLRFKEGTLVPEPSMVIFMIYRTFGLQFFCKSCGFELLQRAHSPQVLPDGSASRAAGNLQLWFFSNLVDKMPDYKRLISCDINMLWLRQYVMYIDITRTPRLRRCMSDELKSMAHSLRTAGPGNALTGFEGQITPTKLEKTLNY